MKWENIKTVFELALQSQLIVWLSGLIVAIFAEIKLKFINKILQFILSRTIINKSGLENLKQENETYKNELKKLNDTKKLRSGYKFLDGAYWKNEDKSGPYCPVCLENKEPLPRRLLGERPCYYCGSCKEHFRVESEKEIAIRNYEIEKKNKEMQDWINYN